MMKTHLNVHRSPRSSVREQVPYVSIVVLLTACKLGPWHWCFCCTRNSCTALYWRPCLWGILNSLSGWLHRRGDLPDSQRKLLPLVAGLLVSRLWAQQSAFESGITKPVVVPANCQLGQETESASVLTAWSAPSRPCCCLQGWYLLLQSCIICSQLLYLAHWLWWCSHSGNGGCGYLYNLVCQHHQFLQGSLLTRGHQNHPHVGWQLLHE